MVYVLKQTSALDIERGDAPHGQPRCGPDGTATRVLGRQAFDTAVDATHREGRASSPQAVRWSRVLREVDLPDAAAGMDVDLPEQSGA